MPDNSQKRPDARAKISKLKHTFLITIPTDKVQRLDLKAKQRMAVYSDDYSEKKIYAVPLGEDQPDPPYECSIRTLGTSTKYSLTLSIPTKIMKDMELEQGDYLLVRTGTEHGFKFLVFKPDRPDTETLIHHNEDGTSTVNKTSLKPDGTPDTSKAVVKETVQREVADKLVENIEAGGKNVAKIFEFSNIDLFVPDDYEGEKFLTSDDIKKDTEHKKLRE